MTQIDYQKLAAAMNQQMATSYKTPTGNPSANVAHGPGGLLSPLGLSPGIANAMIMPSLGVASTLPMRPSRDENPLYGIFTGVTATSGVAPSNRCDDPQQAGYSKLCTQTSVWGWFGLRSREFLLTDAGQRINRGEFMDQRLIGNPLLAPQQPQQPANLTADFMQNFINTEVGKMSFELAVALQRDQAQEVYTGNPAANSGNGREFYRGLDLLINTGYQDAVTGQACPAADSIIFSFGGQDIETNAGDVVHFVTTIHRNIQKIASQAGFSGVQLAISMRWELFYALTELWPCAYNTYRCQNLPTGSVNNLDASRMNETRDSMRGDWYNRTGQYLLIDGIRVPVLLDDAITETETAPGVFRSDMYFIPLTVNNNRSAPISEGGGISTYFEFYPMSGSADLPFEVSRLLAPDGSYFVGGNRRYLFHRYYPKNLCVQIAAWNKLRLRLETPYLAARFTDLQYTPLQHSREPFTDDAYFVNGGRTNYVGFGPSYFPPTA